MKKTVFYVLVISVFAGILASPPAVRAQEQGKEELKLQLPKPMFIGTPRNINSPNLERSPANRAAPSSSRRERSSSP